MIALDRESFGEEKNKSIDSPPKVAAFPKRIFPFNRCHREEENDDLRREPRVGENVYRWGRKEEVLLTSTGDQLGKIVFPEYALPHSRSVPDFRAVRVQRHVLFLGGSVRWPVRLRPHVHVSDVRIPGSSRDDTINI